MSINSEHLKFKMPFTCLVSGPTGSGKTVFIRKLINNHSKLFKNSLPNIRILWCYGIFQPFMNIPFTNYVQIKYIEGMPTDSLINEYKPNILIIDDLLNEFDKNKKLENIFIKKSHHKNISVIFAVQNLFHKSLRTISLNCHYIVLLKNPREASQVMNLAKQIYPGNSKYMTEAYKDSTNKPYGYLLLDLTPDTPEEIRLRTRIFPDETINSYVNPIIYKPN